MAKTLIGILLAGVLASGVTGCKKKSTVLDYFVDKGQQGEGDDWPEAGIAIASGDLNNDSFNDIVTVSTAGQIRYFENDRRGNLVYKGIVGSVGDWAGAGIGITLIDLNFDGKRDILTTGPRGQIWYFENTNIPKPTRDNWPREKTGYYENGIYMGDD